MNSPVKSRQTPMPAVSEIPSRGGIAPWQVHLLPASDAQTAAAVAEILRAHPDTQVRDTLVDQLRELFEIRDPAATIPEASLDDHIRRHLFGEELATYGTWVWYSWSRQLVRVLPEAEFAEVRLSRNRNKITREEQQRLSALRIGVVGLSVGQATAVTLAMEGIGGDFVLADFDTLGLSNLNRLRAGVHDLGINKAVLTARQMQELNPYLRVRIRPDGLREDALESFMTEGGPLDLVVEECDDMLIKWRVREVARAHRIPVVMETSDRATLDIERFDLEPARPLFHGRVDDYDADRIRSLSAAARVQVSMAILGPENLSPRLAASALEIGTTLRSWPQLASAVSLGAGLSTDSIRRMALGEFRASGRYYVDLESIVRDGPAPSGAITPDVRTEPTRPQQYRAARYHESVSRIVSAAAAAPSGGNAQPWRFEWNGLRLRCFLDRTRVGGLLDYASRASWLALGAAAENALLAARALGHRAALTALPDPNDALVAFDLHLDTAGRRTNPDPLHAEIERRCTNRRMGSSDPVSPAQSTALRDAATQRGASLVLLEEPAAKVALGSILGRGDRLRFLSPSLHADLVAELRWSAEEAERTRDGIDVRTLELSALDHAALRLTASRRVMELVGLGGGGASLEKFGQRAAESAAAIGVLTIPGADAAAFFRGGRAMQRVWLTASALGLGFQPLAALPYLFMRAIDGGSGLERSEAEALLALRAEARTVVAVPAGHSELLWFRVARVPPPTVRALRRSVTDILSFTD